MEEECIYLVNSYFISQDTVENQHAHRNWGKKKKVEDTKFCLDHKTIPQ